MRKTSKHVVFADAAFAAAIAVIIGASFGIAKAQVNAAAKVAPVASKPAEEAYKNIQVLKGTPADQVLPAMQFMSASLGVECEFCHVEHAFDKDDKKEKQVAREMIRMTNAINSDHFKGKREVTCNSCHHGVGHPAGIPAIPENDAPVLVAGHHGEVFKPSTTPDEIISSYIKALGGTEAIQRVSTRVQSGTATLPGGQKVPVDIYAKSPDKRVSVMHMPNGDSITAYSVTSGWLGYPGRPTRDMSSSEGAAAALDANLHLATDFKKVFSSFRVGRPETIGGHEANLLIAIREGQPPVRFYFDKQTALLVREIRYAETPLGRNPTQIDYADYRDSNGVKIPFSWAIARPSGRFTIQVNSVKENAPIEDTRFSKPQQTEAANH